MKAKAKYKQIQDGAILELDEIDLLHLKKVLGRFLDSDRPIGPVVEWPAYKSMAGRLYSSLLEISPREEGDLD